MSADNYGVCPQCTKDGIVSDPVNTLREEWDIGMDEKGEFEVEYKCTCRECGFSFRFHRKAKAKLK